MDTKETDIFGENLSDACTCWVCFEIFQDPTTLPCSHSMCRECLMKAYLQNPSCPFCRRPFSPPFPPVNQDLKQLVDEHKKSVRSKPSEQKVPLLMLPDEMLIEIFSHLREKEIGRIAQVCKHLNRITDNGWLWRLLCTESFPFLVVDESKKNWKNCYRFRYRVKRGWEGGRAGDFIVIPMRGHKNYITSFDFYRSHVVSGSADSTVKVWKTTEKTPLHTLSGHMSIVTCVKFNEVWAVSGSKDSTTRVWDVNSGQCVHVLRNDSIVNEVLFDQNSLVTASGDHTVRMWDLRSGKEEKTNQHQRAVFSIQKLPNGNIVSGTVNSLRTIDKNTFNTLNTINFEFGHEINTFHVANDKVIAGEMRGDVKVYDLKTSTVLYQHHLSSPVTTLKADGDKAVCGTENGELIVLDIKNYRVLHTLPGHSGSVNDLQFDDKKLVTAGEDNAIKVWSLESGKCMYALLGGSLQQRANNPPHPTKPGCSQVMYDYSKIVGSFNSMLRVYSFAGKDTAVDDQQL